MKSRSIGALAAAAGRVVVDDVEADGIGVDVGMDAGASASGEAVAIAVIPVLDSAVSVREL
jgi:uncharacterized protein YwlG (UPF0340 family)